MSIQPTKAKYSKIDLLERFHKQICDHEQSKENKKIIKNHLHRNINRIPHKQDEKGSKDRRGFSLRFESFCEKLKGGKRKCYFFLRVALARRYLYIYVNAEKAYGKLHFCLAFLFHFTLGKLHFDPSLSSQSSYFSETIRFDMFSEIVTFMPCCITIVKGNC